MEKAILAKMKDSAQHLLASQIYQTGFKEGKSTAIHASRLLQEVHGRKKRKYNLLVDLQKAYDSVDRELLFRILRDRAKNEMEGHLLSLIEELHRTSLIEVGTSTLVAEMGLPQGSVLSPLLFNIYLEEALKTS
jgi:retron-type reverse transcriptase